MRVLFVLENYYPFIGGAEVLFKATNVEGVYSSDPTKDKRARLYHSLTYLDMLQQRLKVMDATAISLCMENGLPIIVFNLSVEGNIERVLMGKTVGTRVSQ